MNVVTLYNIKKSTGDEYLCKALYKSVSVLHQQIALDVCLQHCLFIDLHGFSVSQSCTGTHDSKVTPGGQAVVLLLGNALECASIVITSIQWSKINQTNTTA